MRYIDVKGLAQGQSDFKTHAFPFQEASGGREVSFGYE